MNQQAIDNRQWLRDRMDERGLTVALMAKAADVAGALVPSAAPWFENYASAYGDGHNEHHLHSRRLDHYASAYADMCEQVDLTIDLASFFAAWNAGATFEGTETEHWYFACQRER